MTVVGRARAKAIAANLVRFYIRKCVVVVVAAAVACACCWDDSDAKRRGKKG